MLPFPIISNTNITLVPKIVDIKCSNTSVFILYDNGELYGFGRNLYGELGVGVKAPVTTVRLLETNVSKMWVGLCDILFVKDGRFYTAGIGYLVDSTNITRLSFTDITSYFSDINTNSIKKIEIGVGMYILMNDGTMYASGANFSGEHGTGSTTKLVKPTIVQTGVTDVKTNFNDSTFILKDNKIYSAGLNSFLQLGNSTSTANVMTYTVVNKFNSVSTLNNLVLTRSVSFYNDSGTVYGSGSQGSGAFGNGVSTGNISLFGATIPVPSTFTSKMIYLVKESVSPIICCSDGFYFSGANNYGEFGTGENTAKSSFTRMSTMDNYVQDYTKVKYVLGNVFNTYFVYNNKLYGAGSAVNGNIPGISTGNILSFRQIELPY